MDLAHAYAAGLLAHHATEHLLAPDERELAAAERRATEQARRRAARVLTERGRHATVRMRPVRA
ncbi:hypothetical protein ABIQ69_06060 [Agromyces sp. G08B096]|uniref:Uncharacterized protein n=1 Tax=Agromyces sp. G08B096 TaxID=3156399 RepID=A0AAU7WA28_9MICO